MKYLLFGILMTASVLNVSAQSAYTSNDGMLHVDLKKAIDIALDENPTIRVAEKEVELKVLADEEAWQALLPEIAVNGSLQHTLLAAEMKLGDNSFKMGRDNTNTVNVGASLNVPVFAPTVYQNMKLTKEDIKLAQEKARGSKLELINQVTKAYYQALLAKDSYQVMKQSYETSKLNYEVISERERVGKVSEYDKLSAEVQMRSMNSSMVSAENGETLSIPVMLTSLGGLNGSVDFEITPDAEKGAVEGTHFTVLNESRTLSFTADAPTQYIKLKIIDNDTFGGDVKMTITLKNAQGNTEVVKPADIDLLGGNFREVTDALKEELGISYGLEVLKVNNGALKDAGINKGFIIQKANDEPIKNIDQLQKVVKAASTSKEPVLFIQGIYPTGKKAYYAVDLSK